MSLRGLSLSDLLDLQAGLGPIVEAARLLSDGGLEPQIDLTGAGSVLRVRSVLPDLSDDDAPVIEVETDYLPGAGWAEPMADFLDAVAASSDFAQQVSPDPVSGPDVALADPVPAPPAPPAATKKPVPRKPDIRTRAKVTQAGDTLILGPFTDDERAVVRAAASMGLSAKAIAAQMNRRPQAVGLLLQSMGQAAAQARVPLTPVRPAAKDRLTFVSSQRAAAPAAVPPSSDVLSSGGPRAAETAPGHAGPPEDALPDADGGAERPGPGPACEPVQGVAPATPAAPGPARDEARDEADVGRLPVGAAGQVLHDPRDLVGDLTGEARRVFLYLADMPPETLWGPDLDLEMCELLNSGTPAGQCALILEVEMKDLRRRWGDLSATIRNDKGHVRIDGQQALLEALRHRAKLARAPADKTAVLSDTRAGDAE